jgi:hypothetical protein
MTSIASVPFVIPLSLWAANAPELRLHRDAAAADQDGMADHFVPRASRHKSETLSADASVLSAQLQPLLNSLLTYVRFRFLVQLSLGVFRIPQAILEKTVKGRQCVGAVPLLKLDDPGTHRSRPSVWNGS